MASPACGFTERFDANECDPAANATTRGDWPGATALLSATLGELFARALKRLAWAPKRAHQFLSIL